MEKSSGSSKAELRVEARKRRDLLPAALRAESSAVVTRRVLAMREFEGAGTVLAYQSFGSELDTAALLTAVLARGKVLLLPRVNREAGLLEVYRVKDLDADLRAGVWGIREPDPEECEMSNVEQVDLAIVPGLAFDRTGGRVGYGKGYYDGLLARFTGYKVAVAFQVQVFDAVPMELYDVRMDLLVTEGER